MPTTVAQRHPVLVALLALVGLTACAEPPNEVATSAGALRSSDGTIADVVSADDNYSILLAAVEYAGLTGALADPDAQLTVLAPTNAAFEATLSELGLEAADLLTEENKDLLTSILLYHVVPTVAPRDAVLSLSGGSVDTLQGDAVDIEAVFGRFIRLNGSVFVIDADNFGSNGVVHGINRVLLPPSIFSTPVSILDKLTEQSRYSTLVAALEFTGLDAALDNPEAELTLLAPDNRAFERTLRSLGLEAADLLTEENKELTSTILLYHVISGEVRSDAVRAAVGSSVPTLQGESVDIGRRWVLLTLNRNAFVTRVDIDADNGVIHGISRVLLPPSLGL